MQPCWCAGQLFGWPAQVLAILASSLGYPIIKNRIMTEYKMAHMVKDGLSGERKRERVRK